MVLKKILKFSKQKMTILIIFLKLFLRQKLKNVIRENCFIYIFINIWWFMDKRIIFETPTTLFFLFVHTYVAVCQS